MFASKTSAPASSGIGQMLRQRLDEKKALKESTLLKISRVDALLRKNMTSAQNKSRGKRETPEEIDAHRVRLERERTDTSVSLQQEKKLLREMEQLDKLKKTEVDIQAQRAELNTLRDLLRETGDAISELESALIKVNLADRLNCATTDLKERTIDCPASKMAHVIGKNGSTITQIERKTCVQMEVDKKDASNSGEDGKIRLVGTDAAIQHAINEIENITLAIEEDVKISSVLSSYLSSKRYAALEQIRASHPEVHVDLNPNGVRLRGRTETLIAAKSEILSFNCKRATITISSREVGLVVGKGGSNIQAMEKDHDVSVNVENNDPDAIIEIIGISSNVDEAHRILTNLIHDNQDIEESVLCTPTQRNMFLDNQAAVLKEIQKALNEQGQGVLLTFEKSDDPDQRSSSSRLLMKARRTAIEEVRRLVQEKIEAYDAGVVTVDVDASIIPKIIGKGGEQIRRLEEECPGASFDVEKNRATVVIHAEDRDVRDGAIAKINEIIQNNQIVKIDIPRNMIGQLLGDPGKAVRSKISDDIGAWMGLSDDDAKVVVQGNPEQIEEGAREVRRFIHENYSLELEVPSEDEQLLFAGGEKSILNTCESEFEVKATFIRAKGFVVLRGTEESVLGAKRAIEESLTGGGDWHVARITVPDKFKGIVVGRGGANLTKLETDYEGLTATLLRSNNQLVLRAKDAELLKTAKQSIVKMLATVSVTELMPISGFYYETLSANNTMRSITDGLSVTATLEKETLKLRGIESDVREAQARITEKMTGKYVAYIPLEQGQYDKLLKAASDKFQQISDSTKARVSLDEAELAIRMEGSRTKVKKAKFTLLKFLDFLLPSQFAKVNIPKQALRTVGDPAVLADVACDTGAFLWLDRDISCIFIRSPEAKVVAEAMKALAVKKEESDKLATVIELGDEDQWLVPKILGKAGSNINRCRKESGARIDVSKEDLVITITGEDEQRQLAKDFLEDFIAKARRECAFITVPQAASNAFIGKGGVHIRKLQEDYEVSIDRERERPAVRVAGPEDKVALATEAIRQWVATWEEENSTKTLTVKNPSMLSAIVGKGGGVIRSIEEETGCKVQVDRATSSVTVRGPQREQALAKVAEIIEREESEAKARAEERDRQMKEAQAAQEAERLAKAQERASQITTQEEEKAQASASAAVPTSPSAVSSGGIPSSFRAVPVGMQSKPSPVVMKPDPYVTKAGRELLEFLQTDGPWESNATVQELLNDNMDLVKERMLQQNGSTGSNMSSANNANKEYYRGPSGLVVRL